MSVATPSISTLTLFTATGKPAGMLLLAVLIAVVAACCDLRKERIKRATCWTYKQRVYRFE
jgi:hypothetical protein